MTSVAYEQLALQFAQALVAGDFNSAYHLLSEQAQHTWTAEALQHQYQTMVNYFSPDAVQVDSYLTDWANKQPNDLAWFYISIVSNSQGQAEAMTVIIADQQGKAVIREIEWNKI